jgi:hypothetical protein
MSQARANRSQEEIDLDNMVATQRMHLAYQKRKDHQK